MIGLSFIARFFLYCLTIAGLFLILSFCKSRVNENFTVYPQDSSQRSIDTTELTNKLSYYFEQSHHLEDSVKYKVLFFDAFPSNFNEFNSLYSYSEEDGEMPLYNKHEEHVSLFCDLSSLSKEKFASKVVKLGLNGHWEADAVNMLQHCALAFTNENIELIAKELTGYKSDDIKSFFFFLFDGPHIGKNIPVDIEEIQISYPQIYETAKDTFEQVQIQAEEDEH